MRRNFMKLLSAKFAENKMICVGLDTVLEKIPQAVKGQRKYARFYSENAGRNGVVNQELVKLLITDFNNRIINATNDVVCAYKPNKAFYDQYGVEGFEALQIVTSYINQTAPSVPVILDAKVGDIGNTNEAYARALFDKLGADAITVSPYLGSEAMKPFLDRADKGIIVLCRTSNAGSDEFQLHHDLYKRVAEIVAEKWNYNGNCMLVVGAQHPKELEEVRGIVGNMPILVPGIGAQGGNIEAVLEAGLNHSNTGLIINSSREIIYASDREDFASIARSRVEELNKKLSSFMFDSRHKA